MDYSFMFGEYLPSYIPIYTLNIELISDSKGPKKPIDERIEITVAAILQSFFEEVENVMVYICDNLDNKHHARKRKFDSWYAHTQNSQIEKYDFIATTEDFELLNSVFVYEVKKVLVVSFVDNFGKKMRGQFKLLRKLIEGQARVGIRLVFFHITFHLFFVIRKVFEQFRFFFHQWGQRILNNNRRFIVGF